MLNRQKIDQTLRAQLEINMRRLEREKEKVQSAPFKVVDPTLPLCVLIDIDGTLAFRGERGIYDFEKCSLDQPCTAVISILQQLARVNSEACEIFCVTGREEMYREVTEQWLKANNVPFDHVYMRRTGDRRPSQITKEDIYVEHIKGRYNVLFCIDDKLADVTMYRSQGLYCFISDNSR